MTGEQSRSRQQYVAARKFMFRFRDIFTRHHDDWYVWQDADWLYHGDRTQVFRTPYPDPWPIPASSSRLKTPRWFSVPSETFGYTSYWKNNYFWFFDEETWTWDFTIAWNRFSHPPQQVNEFLGETQLNMQIQKLSDDDSICQYYRRQQWTNPPVYRAVLRLRFDVVTKWDGQGVLIFHFDDPINLKRQRGWPTEILDPDTLALPT